MKDYIKQNWKPLIVGYAITITICNIIEMFDSIIMKIAILIITK